MFQFVKQSDIVITEQIEIMAFTDFHTLCFRLLNKVMWDYRAERWWLLLTSILDISLKCAYLTAKVQDYVSNCMELIGSCILLR